MIVTNLNLLNLLLLLALSQVVYGQTVDNTDSNDHTDVKKLCAHWSYPCFYYYCDERSILNEKSRIFKCAKGLIYDEKIQHCIWAMPWQTCTLNDKSGLFKPLQPQSSSQQFVFELNKAGLQKTKTPSPKPISSKLNVVEPRPSIAFNGNSNKKVSTALFESLALSLKLKDANANANQLANINLQRGVASSLLPSVVENQHRFDVLITAPPKEKPNEKRDETAAKLKSDMIKAAVFGAGASQLGSAKLMMPSGSRASGGSFSSNNIKNMVQVSDQVEYYDSDFNVTMDETDADDDVEFDEQSEVAPAEQYAYIVVPIKISKNRKLPDLNPSSSSSSLVNRKKNKKVMKESKNLEGNKIELIIKIVILKLIL